MKTIPHARGGGVVVVVVVVVAVLLFPLALPD